MRETSRAKAPAATGNGFQLSAEPLVELNHGGETEEDLPATYGRDLVYAIARDPASLFVYWDVNWPRVFERAGLAPRPVHLRVVRADDEVESLLEINPFRGHCYIELAKAGATYSCEVGCFNAEEWIPLLPSATAATPRQTLSEDLSATFATLPIHLSFQRLLDVFDTTGKPDRQLAHNVAKLQAETSAAPDEVTLAKESGGATGDALAALRQLTPPAVRPLPAAVQDRLWRQLAEPLGSAIEDPLGGSSRG